MTDIIVVEKTGLLRNVAVKQYNEAELYKKCGFKKGDDFLKHGEWTIKLDKTKYTVSLYGKLQGKANTENKYDFPPPMDTMLFFGACALVCQLAGSGDACGLSLDMWHKMYEKLFGGFEDLAACAEEDENEIDELANVPSEKKTKSGYLKDGFIVDTSESEEDAASEDASGSLEDSMGSETSEDGDIIEELALTLDDIGSELEEEDYDYDDEDDDDEANE